MAKSWFLKHTYVCECGNEYTLRERIKGKPPADRSKRSRTSRIISCNVCREYENNPEPEYEEYDDEDDEF